MDLPMPPEPVLVRRPEQPYAAIYGVVTMDTIAQIADRIPEVFGWLAARGIPPAGPPFLRYNTLGPGGRLEIEAGVPVASAVNGAEPVLAGVLPAGRYAVVRHIGPFSELAEATRDLLGWAATRGLAWDVTESPAGERWGCRLEIYFTNPAGEPDPATWETELAFRLAG
jgi:effector-binding domain-containing protein